MPGWNPLHWPGLLRKALQGHSGQEAPEGRTGREAEGNIVFMTNTEDTVRKYEARIAELEARLRRMEQVVDGPGGARSPSASPGGQNIPRIGEGYRLGVDVGGTFTDLMLIDERSGKTHVAKVASTPKDSSQGVLRGIEKICREANVDPSQINFVMHGTTVATNTVLTGSGAL
ncbi:MAG: hydantoinase/oxoprolinase N-terminal domain-containing protein, partial [Pseudomonadota bacterium]|nr:hydantoinase/oxoprolinase N-terminal domain-containing protein [Pseudomonadota bacterium]